MHISRLRIKNYKAFIDSGDIALTNNITAVTGKNNVGKSLLLELLNLFGKKVSNPTQCLPRLESSTDKMPRLRVILAMQSDDLLHYMGTNRKQFVQQIESIVTDLRESLAPPEKETLEKVRRLLAHNQFANIEAEFVLLKHPFEKPLRFDAKFGSWLPLRISIEDTALGVETTLPPPRLETKGSNKLTVRLLEFGQISSLFEGIVKAFRSLGDKTFRFNPHRVLSPKLEVEVKHDEDLLPDGSNLREVVFTLHNNRNRYQDDDFPRLERFISSVFPEISHIRTPITPQAKFTESSSGATGTDIKFVMRDNPPERSDLYMSISESGTGVEQLLALATKVITSKDPHLFLIDEPHAFLHPDAERKLIAFLRQQKQHQYIIATNSPVILNSVRPEAVQLLVRDGQNTGVRGIHKEKIEDLKLLFQELGLRSTDIWHSDKIIWVEGPTEENILPLILETVGIHPELAGVKVIGLRRASLFTSAKPKIKRRIYETVKFITETLTPLPPDYRFLFDLNEKTSGERKRIQEIAHGRVIFLDRREIENYLLDPDVIHEVISREMDEPVSKESFVKKFDSLINSTGNKKLYPERPDTGDIIQVKGSALLEEIYQEYLRREYNKGRDGVKLTSVIAEKSPANFDFFKNAPSEFIHSS